MRALIRILLAPRAATDSAGTLLFLCEFARWSCRMRCLCTFAAALMLPSLLAAHTPAQAPSDQTARQALIEMFFGQAANHLEKHLPDVTRKTFQRMDSGNGQSFLSEFSMLAAQAKSAGAALQTFDTGPILLSAADPRGEAEKVEITVERDDLV